MPRFRFGYGLKNGWIGDKMKEETKKKLFNKKNLAALVTLLCGLAAALGLDIDESIQKTIIEVGAGLIGGGVAGFAGA